MWRHAAEEPEISSGRCFLRDLVRGYLDRLDPPSYRSVQPSSGPRSPPRLHEEVLPDPQPPTLTNDVYSHDGEEANLRVAPATGNPPAYQEPYSGYRDSQPASIHRNLGGIIDPEEISSGIRSEPLLLYFSVANAFRHRFWPQIRLRRMKSGSTTSRGRWPNWNSWRSSRYLRPHGDLGTRSSRRAIETRSESSSESWRQGYGTVCPG